ncbi:MAG: hypothetical protein KAY44_03945 [Neisseria sp.]|jgi:hypothetical protein|nr:hypothetical protein [Neisseria sp.]MBP8045735.1 hypothetical protein [Neisseria sp.]MBP8069905.1 hypothetical protein [Neisseria sp.]
MMFPSLGGRFRRPVNDKRDYSNFTPSAKIIFLYQAQANAICASDGLAGKRLCAQMNGEQPLKAVQTALREKGAVRKCTQTGCRKKFFMVKFGFNNVGGFFRL